jgi:hypothetical protein
MFDGWFPLKHHLEHDAMCSLREMQEQRKIRVMRQIREGKKNPPKKARTPRSLVKRDKDGNTYRLVLPTPKASNNDVEKNAPPDIKPAVDRADLATDVHKLISIRFSFPDKELKGSIAPEDLIVVKNDFTVASIAKDFRTGLVERLAAKRHRNEDSKFYSIEPPFVVARWLNMATIKVSEEPHIKPTKGAETYLLETGEDSTAHMCAIIQKYLFHALIVPEKDLPLRIEFNMS